MNKSTEKYDVVIVGGGSAGLSAGLMLGRSRRSVAVIDGGEPRNAPAAAVHSFLTRDGMPPADLVAVGRTEVETYGGRIIAGRVGSAHRDRGGFTVTLEDGQAITGSRLLIATGLTDKLPDVPGVRERWGRDVLHCPYCHGWEVRDQHIGILASGPMSMHQAMLFPQWSSSVTLFLNDALEPTDEEWEKLAARGVTVVDGTVESLMVEDDSLTGVRLNGGTAIPVQALVVMPRFAVRAGAFASLGLNPVTHPSGLGDHLEVNESGATEVPGIWAAGNVTNPMAQVLASAAAGSMAGAVINMDLVDEELTQALALRDPFSAESEARNTERVLGDRRHGLEVAQP